MEPRNLERVLHPISRSFCSTFSAKAFFLENLIQLMSSATSEPARDKENNRNMELSNHEFNSRDCFDILVALHSFPDVIRSEHVHRLCLKVCDEPSVIKSIKDLLVMGEFAANKVTPPDYALFSSVVEASQSRLSFFSAVELSGLLALCARMDYVDSSFSEAIMDYLPTVLSNFPDNHFPQLLAACLRLGLDQPVDRVPLEDKASNISSPFMEALISEMVGRVSKISEGGCLAILHSIVRRPKGKISSEMDSLVRAISDTVNFENWSLSMRIQAVHALSRLGINNQSAIGALFLSVDADSITKIPSANLQHLLSIVHNHAAHHDADLCQRVLNVCMQRICHPAVSKTMPMATVAVTIGYLGRLGLSNGKAMDSLLRIFAGERLVEKKGRNLSLEDRITGKFIVKILTDPQVDVAHLTGILEAIDRLNMWHLPLSVPLLLITRRLIVRDGIHNVRTAPLGILCQCLLKEDFGLSGKRQLVKGLDIHIDKLIDAVPFKERSGNWSLQSSQELGNDSSCWRRSTVLGLLEGLLKHEQYIKSAAASPSVKERCMQIGSQIDSLIPWSDVPANIQTFFRGLDTE